MPDRKRILEGLRGDETSCGEREASSVSPVMFAELVVSTSISLPPCSENQPFMTGISSLCATESRVGHRARWGNTDERNHEVVKTAESLK